MIGDAAVQKMDMDWFALASAGYTLPNKRMLYTEQRNFSAHSLGERWQPPRAAVTQLAAMPQSSGWPALAVAQSGKTPRDCVAGLVMSRHSGSAD